MKRIKYLLVFSLLMFIPNIVSAECSFKEKSKLQNLASNLNFTYNYKEIEGKEFPSIEFSVTIANLQPELYIVSNASLNNYYYNGNSEITINGFEAGKTLEFEVYARNGECKNTYLLTNYVTLPPFNKYYKSYICKDITDYGLCKRWSHVSMSYEKFLRQVSKYKESLIVEEPIEPVKPDIVEKILEFLSKYSFYLFGGIIVVCSIAIYYLDKKNSFDLE